MKRMKRLAALLMTALMCISVTACGSGTDTGSGSDSGTPTFSNETLKVALDANPTSLDGLVNTTAIVRHANVPIYEGLLEMNSKYEPSCQLAKDYKINDDYTEFTFYLRDDVTFHNGKKMTSEDVVASMNRWLKLNSSIKTMVTHGEQFVALDDYTVQLKLEEPCYLFTDVMIAPMSFPVITTKECVESATDKGLTEYIGTGPLKLDEWKVDQYLHFVRNEDYKSPGYALDGDAGDRTVYFNDVYYYIVTDTAIRNAGIQSGEYDVIMGVGYSDVESLSKNSSVQLGKYLYCYNDVIFNKAEGIMSNEKIREAISYAINADEVLKAAYPADGYTMTTRSMMYDGSKFSTTAGTEEMNKYDPEKAKQLLKEAGYNGETVRILGNQVYQHHYNGSLVLKQELEAVGINVDLEIVDWSTELTMRKDKGQTDMYVMSYPFVTAPISYRALSTTDEGFSSWPELSTLKAKVNNAGSDTEAVAAWSELQTFVMDKWSFVPLGYNYGACAASSSIKAFTPFNGVRVFGCYR